jgi:hypothetical protein
MCMCVSLDFVYFSPPETFVILGPQLFCFNSHMPLGLGMRAFLGHCVFCVYVLPPTQTWVLMGPQFFL